MDAFDASTYGERIAEVYDSFFDSPRMDPTAAVRLLAEFARGGRALELGVGTGRVAIPLAMKGVDVTGIDASLAMIEKMRAKPGGDKVNVVVDDFANVAVEGMFSLVYIPFATIFSLLTQEEQIRCLVNSAAHLEVGGRFVLETFVVDTSWWTKGQAVSVQRVETDKVILVADRHDPITQRIDSCYVVLQNNDVRVYPVPLRWASPAELDAMALFAGLELEDRFEDYEGTPFTVSSSHHVSIYRKMAGATAR